jgi:hypothetical protein
LDHAEVRAQLHRILNSPHFKTSRRYPSVLKYLVENALDEARGVLKERTIGIDVLGREPDYDTNQDPTVRVVVGEIRKRLSSYYQEPSHAHEIRIELPIGSYVPNFAVAELSFGPPAAPSISPSIEAKPQKRQKRRNLFWVGGIALATAALITVGYLWPTKKALDRFWGPVLRGSPSVLLCVGQQIAWGTPPRLNDPLNQVSTSSNPAPSLENDTANSVHRFFSTQPVFTLMTLTAETNIAAFLRSRTSKEVIRAAGATSLADLRQGPAVLIGSFSNYWTMHLLETLRYRMRRSNEEGVNWIEDRDNLSKRDWAVKVNAPYTDVTAEYGLISKVRDPSTGQIVVTVGGVTAIGTVAASEFVVNPAGWEMVAQHAPRDWEHKNMQIVIGVNVINGNAGTPSVLATYFW